MQLLSQIPFAILNNIGFVAILYLLYQIMKYYFSFSATSLFTLASILQFIGLLHFIFCLIYPDVISISTFNVVVQDLIKSIPLQPGVNRIAIIGIIYFAVVLYFIINLIVQFFNVAQLKNKADYGQSDYYNQLLNNTTHLNIKIGTSDSIDSPITFGWINPVILLPISICTQLTVKELESILLHEFAHIVRNDYLFNLINSIVSISLFFNPFISFLKNEMMLQREIVCDELVVYHKIERGDYMNALLKLAVHSRNQPHIKVSLGLLSSKNQLLQRIKKLNNINIKSGKLFFTQLLIGTMGGIIFLCPFIQWNKASNEIKQLSVQYSTAKNKIPHIKQTHHKNGLTAAVFQVKKQMTVQHYLVTNSTDSTLLKKNQNFKNDSYATVVKKAIQWIKEREPVAVFASYDQDNELYNQSITEKLLMQSIVKNYRLKRAMLYSALTKALNESNEKEAMDYVLNSPEWEEMLQFEKWTKEILQKQVIHDNSVSKIDSSFKKFEY